MALIRKTGLIVFAVGLLILALDASARMRRSRTSDSTDNYTFSRVELTAYSAGYCRYDRSGGGYHASSDRRINPRNHTIDGKRDSDNVVVAAVPQWGGTSPLYGCFFKVVFPQKNLSSTQKKMEEKVFFAADHYGAGSDGRRKIDISYECHRGLDEDSFYGARIQRLSCPGASQAYNSINQMTQQIASEKRTGSQIANNKSGGSGHLQPARTTPTVSNNIADDTSTGFIYSAYSAR